MGLIRALGPLGLYRGDSGRLGCPTKIQNKKFEVSCACTYSLTQYIVETP
jgi:hypothetical protein